MKKEFNRWSVVKGFITARFSSKTFAGLPLTILLVAFIIDLLLFLDFVEDFINSKSFVVADACVSAFFFSIRTESISKFFYSLTMSGNNLTIGTISFSSALFFLWKKKYDYILGLFVAVAGSAITIYSGKNTFHILRPAQNAYYLVKSFSFPSGHATYAVSLYGLLFYLSIRNTTITHSRPILITIALLFILLLGISRLYLGVHFLSDVLGGYLLGTLWLLSAIFILEWKEYRLSMRKPSSSKSLFRN